ncbi:MAG: TetR/AcrR family transcriptional regulator [Bacillota bacterium]|nr:TetR/AcrR family transcriptional regulator [Bacillota bacterium]
MNKKVMKNIKTNAYTLFKEKGYKETTILDICEACSITKTTFYRYVHSKEDLLAYYFDDIQDNLGPLVVQIAQSDNYVENIICAFDLVINQMKTFGRDLYSQLYISNLNTNQDTFEDIPLFQEIVVALIEKGQKNGQIINMASSQELFQVTKNLCFGCGIRWCLNQIEDVREEFVKSIKIVLQVVDD